MIMYYRNSTNKYVQCICVFGGNSTNLLLSSHIQMKWNLSIVVVVLKGMHFLPFAIIDKAKNKLTYYFVLSFHSVHSPKSQLVRCLLCACMSRKKK